MAKTLIRLIALVIISTVVTSCGSGQNAVTRNFKQVTDGVEAQSAEIRLRNVKIIKDELSQGILIGTLINWSDQVDVITGISIGGVSATLSAPKFDLLKNKPVIFVGESANADAFALIQKAAGERLPVTFTFASASPVTVDALVVMQDGVYENLLRVNSIPTPVVTEEGPA